MDENQEKLEQPVTLKVLGEFTEEVLLPAIGEMMADKLKNYATKDDLRGFATKDDLRGFATKDDLRGFATKSDLRIFPTKVEIYEILRDYPTKSDLEEHKEEIIKEIRRRMENVVQHQTVVTDVIERKGCAKPRELEILKEAVS